MVSSSAPSVQRSRALRAAALFANSTRPLPVGRPRSSVTTIARSTGPNWENAWREEGGFQIKRSVNRNHQSSEILSQWDFKRSCPAYLFQQLICYNGQQVTHCERSNMCRKADPDWSIIQNRPIQLSFCNLCQRPGFLKDKGWKAKGWWMILMKAAEYIEFNLHLKLSDSPEFAPVYETLHHMVCGDQWNCVTYIQTIYCCIICCMSWSTCIAI